MSKLDQIKEKLKLSALQEKMKLFVAFIRKIGMLLIILGIFLLGFAIGARMFETGRVQDYSNKNLKGVTVYVTGVCLMNGEVRSPALAEDEVTINAVEDEKVLGVIRLTRESIECDLNKVSISKLPLFSKWGTTPAQIPALTAAKVETKVDAFYKNFENKILVISGSCKTSDGKDLAPFIDEKVDVTLADAAKDNPSVFILSGIKRSDRQAVICNSRAITYRLYDSSRDDRQIVQEKPKDYTGKIVVVDSRCLPDQKYQPELKVDPKTKQLIGKRPKFYNLLNSPVQISSYKVNDKDQLVYLEGKIVDRRPSAKAAFGHKIICDSKVDSLVVKEFDVVETSLIDNEGKELDNNLPQKTDVEMEGTEIPQQQQTNPNQGLQQLINEIDGGSNGK